ncbi:DoxX family protein [Rhizobium halophytocola]|uniref:Oxidoreductase n=1 Tax=Rhizobium halophytocola TaxID=735519 RepID=A0ABS4E6F5_9HYPH|nr:DoxX family protein [Rhizobium halophytocola]MBP1853506.1 putative oxidoreductase [Rhizobium halophytocola]
MDLSARLSAFAPSVLSLTRAVSGLLFLEHGTQKLLHFPASEMNPPLMSIFGAAGIIELVCGVLLTIGLFTRPAAFLASGMCAFAYFMVHAPKTFFPALNGGDAAILFCFLFLYLVFAGGGRYSVDAMMRGKA